MDNTTIFDFMYPKYKITKKIRTIEFFGGYGSQLLSLKYLGADVEQWKLCEWAIKSIQAYKDIHFTDDNVDYSKDLSVDEIKDYLFNKGISSNYNEPMTKQHINKLNERQSRIIYNNIKATHNLVNIQQVKGADLEIEDTDKYIYICTYSFPCQDLSNAGKKKGFNDTSTRSGMLWEFERILSECYEIGTLPQILLLENVPQLHSIGENMDNFQKWINRLEEFGYKNYWKDLIATDYGIPQTRNRTFMVSILGNYNYTFPKPIPLKLKLKDMLEDSVDERYFLSESMINYICSRMPTGDNKITVGISIGNRESLKKAGTLTTCSGNRATDNYIIENEQYDYSKEQGQIINTCDEHQTTSEENLEATDVNIVGYIPQWHQRGFIYDENYSSPTICSTDYKTPKLVAKKNKNTANRFYEQALDTAILPIQNLRIRKLTPKECFRLMGVKDEDFEKCAKHQSNSSLYHLAGDSIVCQVLIHLFKQLF